MTQSATKTSASRFAFMLSLLTQATIKTATTTTKASSNAMCNFIQTAQFLIRMPPSTMDAPCSMKNINKRFFFPYALFIVWRMNLNRQRQREKKPRKSWKLCLRDSTLQGDDFCLMLLSSGCCMQTAIFNECGSSHRLRKMFMRH